MVTSSSHSIRDAFQRNREPVTRFVRESVPGILSGSTAGTASRTTWKASLKGFTIFEISVAVVIIGILVALVIPTLVDLHKMAQRRVEDQVVGSVRSGIRTYHVQSQMETRTPLYPATLDNAQNGNVSAENPFFTNVLFMSNLSGWSKANLVYNGPTGTAYIYEPATGIFREDGELLLGWTMDYSGGDTVTAGDYTGQVEGNAVPTDEGKVGDAIHFDGIDSHISIPDEESLDLTTSGTLMSWIYMEGIPAFAGIIHKGDEADFSDEAYSLQFWSGNTITLYLNGAGSSYSQLTTTMSFQTGRWYHIAATWNPSGMKIYVDGTLNRSTTNVVTVRNTTGSVNVGAQTSEYFGGYRNLPFQGIIDEVYIYNRSITPEEVTQYYNSTK